MFQTGPTGDDHENNDSFFNGWLMVGQWMANGWLMDGMYGIYVL
jgi:hypothetical protein